MAADVLSADWEIPVLEYMKPLNSTDFAINSHLSVPILCSLRPLEIACNIERTISSFLSA